MKELKDVKNSMYGDQSRYVDFKIRKNACIPKKYIISYKNKYKVRWDILVIVLAIYNSIIIPLDAAFSPEFI